MIWKMSEAENFFADGSPSETYACEVLIDGSRIVVSYDSVEGGRCVYEGEDVGSGHFELTCSAVRGKASLHRSPSRPDQLEGSWIEEGFRGMWIIDLDDGEE